MKQSKTFVEISKKMEALSKNAKGQLKGGFAVFSGYGGLEKPADSNSSCTNICTSNGDCTNTRNCTGQNVSCPS